MRIIDNCTVKTIKTEYGEVVLTYEGDKKINAIYRGIDGSLEQYTSYNQYGEVVFERSYRNKKLYQTIEVTGDKKTITSYYTSGEFNEKIKKIKVGNTWKTYGLVKEYWWLSEKEIKKNKKKGKIKGVEKHTLTSYKCYRFFPGGGVYAYYESELGSETKYLEYQNGKITKKLRGNKWQE